MTHEIHVKPIFAAFEYPDNEASKAAWHRADEDPQVNQVSVWRSISPDGSYIVIILGEDQAKVERAAAVVKGGAVGNYILEQTLMDSLCKRRYTTAFREAEQVIRGGVATLQQRAHYGDEGVPFIDGEPRP